MKKKIRMGIDNIVSGAYTHQKEEEQEQEPFQHIKKKRTKNT